MSINDINVLRIVFYVTIIAVVFFSTVSAIIKLRKSKNILLEVLIVVISSLISFLIIHFPVLDVYKFTMDENTEYVIKNISSESIDFDVFEPYDDITDRKIATVTNEDTVLYCLI